MWAVSSARQAVTSDCVGWCRRRGTTKDAQTPTADRFQPDSHRSGRDLCHELPAFAWRPRVTRPAQDTPNIMICAAAGLAERGLPPSRSNTSLCPSQVEAPLMSHATARSRHAGTSFESQAQQGPAADMRTKPTGDLTGNVMTSAGHAGGARACRGGRAWSGRVWVSTPAVVRDLARDWL